MALGDGEMVRTALGALVDFLGRFAAPTGARGSVLLMAGGLIVLGFLFVAFIFRSAIVGDLAPVANARAPVPRVELPPAGRPRDAPPRRGHEPFAAGRVEGRAAKGGLDAVFDHLRAHGAEARILESHVGRKRVRLYWCGTCRAGVHGGAGCEHERGLLVGAFEALAGGVRPDKGGQAAAGGHGGVVKAEEVACARAGSPFCEFEVRHPEAKVGR